MLSRTASLRFLVLRVYTIGIWGLWGLSSVKVLQRSFTSGHTKATVTPSNEHPNHSIPRSPKPKPQTLNPEAKPKP